MATRYAVATGNFSAAATWDGGTTIPTTGDDVYSNNFTVTIDTNITVQTLRNTANASPVITLGGGFVVNNGISVTCTGTTVSGFSTGLVQGATATSVFSIAGTNSATLTSNYVGGISGSCNPTVTLNSTGTLTIIGNATGTANASTAQCTNISANGTLTLTGNVLGGSGNANTIGILVSSACTINITGNVTGNVASGIFVLTNSAINLNVTGAQLAGNVAAINHNGSGGSTVSLIGSSTSSSTIAACTFITAPNAIITASGPFVNTNSFMAIAAFRMRIFSTAITSWTFQNQSAGTKILYTADSVLGQPAITDVRNGVSYASGSLTGTCYVPPAASVAFGVPVDNTTGTAMITRAQLITDVGAIVAAYTV